MRTSFAVFAIAIAFAACNHERSSTEGRGRDDPANQPGQQGAQQQEGELHIDGALEPSDFRLRSGSLSDRYELQAEPGDRFEVVLQSSEFDTYLEVVTPDGESLLNDDFPGAENQSRLVVAVRQAGKLKIIVTSDAPDGQGRYRLDVNRSQGTAPPAATASADPRPQLPPDFLPNARRILEGAIANRGHHSFVLPSDPTEPATPGTPPAAPAGPQPGAPQPGTPQPGAPAPQPGTPQPGAPQPGAPQPGAPAPQPGTPQPGTPSPAPPGDVTTPIQMDSQIQGALAQGDGTLATGELRDLYTFEGRAGAPVNIELQSRQFDPYVILVGPSGQQWENDDANGTLNSQLLMSLPEAGTYRIVATSYRTGETGTYLLKLRSGTNSASLPPSVAPQPNQPAQTITGSLAQGDEHLSSGELLDRHRMSWQAGQAVRLRLSSNDFDTYLIVRSPGGRQWDNDDFQRGSLDSGLDFVAPETGEYTIGVTSYRAGETGAYTLTVDATAGAPAPAAPQPGTPQPGTPQPGTPQPGTPQPGVPQPGVPQPGVPQPGVPQPGVPQPGVPQPGVPQPGVPQPGVPQPGAGVGQSIQGMLSQGDQRLRTGEFMDAYPMSFQPGQQVSIRVQSTQFDTYLIVRAPSGRQWDNDDIQPGILNSGLDLTVTEAGTYQVLVTSYRPGETGAYTLMVSQGTYGAPGMPQPGMPQPGMPQPGMPQPGMPQPGMPQPGMPQPGTPQPGTPQPGTPQPGTPQPGMPQPGMPQPGMPQPGGGQVYGIYVGITDYPSGQLPLCADDAIKLARDMRRAGLQTEAQQILLTDRNATPERLRQAFADMAQRVGPNDLFIFFYSGHGAQGNVTPSSQELDQREESINLVGGDITDDEMASLFDQIRSRVAIIALDSCFAGGFARDVISRPGRMGFFSSEEDLTSNVASNFQAGGFLSHFLRLGLRGEADTDPRDALLTAGELSHYLYTMYGTHVQNVEATTTDQQPNYQHLVIDRGSVRVNTPLVSYR